MPAVFAPIISVLIGLFIFQLGNGVLGTLLSLRVNGLGLSTETAGLVTAAYFAGFMAGSVFANRVIAMVGHIRAYASLAAVYTSALLLIPMSDDPTLWYPARFLGGFCVAGMFMIIESWLNAGVANQWRGRVLSIYMIATYGALGLSQLWLNFDSPLGFVLFNIVAICFAMSLVPISLTRWPAPPAPSPSFLRFRPLFELSPLAVVGSFSSGMILSAFYGLAPIFAQNQGLGVSQISLLMTVAILGGLVMQFPAGYFSDRLDRRKVLTAAIFVTAVSSFAIVVITQTAYLWLLIFGGLFYCMSFVIYPLALGHMNDHCGDGDRVAAIGGLLLAYSLGASIGPLPASALMAWIGDFALFIYTGGVALLTGGFALYRMMRRPMVPLAEQGPFVAYPKTTAVATEIDPGAYEE